LYNSFPLEAQPRRLSAKFSGCYSIVEARELRIEWITTGGHKTTRCPALGTAIQHCGPVED
jgi:hypothetical protein